jgi:NEDD4-binding protein 2
MKKFTVWLENKGSKQLVLMRGVSSTGKSTLAKKLVGNGKIFSTDDYFMQDGKYNFDVTKIGRYHKLNQERTEEAMKNGLSPIVIDNTMTQAWEGSEYVRLADKYGYSVRIEELPIPDIDELMKRQESRKNINKALPREVVERMIGKFQPGLTVDDIRKGKKSS